MFIMHSYNFQKLLQITLLTGITAFGCSTEHSTETLSSGSAKKLTGAEVGASANTGAALVSFMFELPSAVPLKSVVVQTGESFRLADAVYSADSPADVINMGDGDAIIGVEAEVYGNVISGGNVLLEDRVEIHGFVHAEGSIEERADVQVDGETVEGIPVDVGAVYRWDVDWPSALSGSYTINSNDSLDLLPGGYADIVVNSGGTLNLSAGTYYLDSFSINAGATVNIDGNGSPVIVYVRDALTCRATLNHAQSSADFFVGFAGDGIVDLGGPFSGTVAAPDATVRLAPLNGESHEGSFFAERLLAEARTPINKVPFAHWHDILSEPEHTVPVEPPDVLPLPPKDAGCYRGTRNGWLEIPCTTAKELDLPNLSIEAIGINSIVPEGGTEQIPFEFGQLQTTFVTYGGLQDSISGKTELSVQMNSNKYQTSQGYIAANQFAIQTWQKSSSPSEYVNGICIWHVNVTDQIYRTTCTDAGRVPMRTSEDFEQYDFANIGASSFTDSNGEPVLGMVVQFTWLDPAAIPADSNGLFAVVASDRHGLGLDGNWTSVSGTVLGMGGASQAQFTDSTILTRTLAGTCANAQGPVPEIPWAGVCEDRPPLIDYTEVGQNPGTQETNNLTVFSGPFGPVSVTNDFVYSQYLASTSGLCESDANTVYIKDVASDVGVVPSNYGKEPYWESPDIFVVPEGTPVDENAVASEALLTPGETYDFYIRVHNHFGCDPILGVKTLIYIADPSALSTVWESVTGGNYVGGPSADGITVQPDSSALIGPITWTAPGDAAQDGHKCVLASIISDTQPEPPEEIFDVASSPRAAQRNVQFTDCAFPLTNAAQDGYLFLSFIIDGAEPSLADGDNTVEITFGDSTETLYAAWYTGSGDDYRVSHLNGETTVRFGSRHVILEPVAFEMGNSIDAVGNIVLLQGEPTTSLAVNAELYREASGSAAPLVKNGATCVKEGTPVVF